MDESSNKIQLQDKWQGSKGPNAHGDFETKSVSKMLISYSICIMCPIFLMSIINILIEFVKKQTKIVWIYSINWKIR